MAHVNTFDTAAPAGSDAPTSGDDEIRLLKDAIVERQQVDHNWPVAGTTYDVDAVGYHSQVTFAATQVQPADPAADVSILYTEAVGGKTELCFLDEDNQKKQITDAGTLNIVTADLPAGGSGVGILKTHLGSAAGDFCDESTLEIDGTNGLQIKVPDELGTDADEIDVAVTAWGEYTGDSNATQVINTGITVRHFTVKQRTPPQSLSAWELIVGGSNQYAWGQSGADDQSSNLSASGQNVTVGAGKNTNLATYIWFAQGERV